MVPRADSNPVYAFAGAFFDELVRSGVYHVCLSPGSRSTPLAVTAAGCTGLRCWSHLDERSAGFFALGLAKASGRPVALVCTSGTAAANYLPAVVEAHYARVPLVLLTADRPPELREWGAGQTIDQLKLYGSHVRYFVELPVPEAGAELSGYVRSLACRAVAEALDDPPGPVHLNWPFREPLEPTCQGGPVEERARADAAYAQVTRGRRMPHPSVVDSLLSLALDCPGGLIACGPDYDRDFAHAVASLARAAGWPILADPTSQLRSGPYVASTPVLENADLLLRDQGFAGLQIPELVMRLGGTPVSKAFRLWLERHRPPHVLVVDPGRGWEEPSALASHLIRVDPASLCAQLADAIESRLGGPRHSDWLGGFVAADSRAGTAIADALSAERRLFAPRAVRELCRLLPAGCSLYVGNSMSVRYLDSFMPLDTKSLRVFGNRGANGIDGLISSALGAAAADRGRVVLLTGDLAFLHDLGGLLAAKRHRLDLTIVVINNDGGGIFSLLPIAGFGEQVDFESLFRMPHGLDLAAAATLFGARFSRVTSWNHYRESVETGLASDGLSIVEVPVDLEAEVEHFRLLVRLAGEAVRSGGPEATE